MMSPTIRRAQFFVMTLKWLENRESCMHPYFNTHIMCISWTMKQGSHTVKWMHNSTFISALGEFDGSKRPWFWWFWNSGVTGCTNIPTVSSGLLFPERAWPYKCFSSVGGLCVSRGRQNYLALGSIPRFHVSTDGHKTVVSEPHIRHRQPLVRW